MTDKMAIWDAVSKTDPKHTRKVNQRGGFTAIDAHYQIQMATEQFGPVGKGWGYTSSDPIFSGDLIIVPVTLWHGDRANTFGPWLGCAVIGGSRVDADAPKKAMTDAITKGLSHLGFNADVFLGKFDDNKYVADRSREAEAQRNAATAAQDGLSSAWHDAVVDSLPENASPRVKAEAFAQAIIRDAKAKTGRKALDNLWASKSKYIDHFEKTYPDLHADLCEVFVARQSEIDSTEAA